jgi:hypothetical protein
LKEKRLNVRQLILGACLIATTSAWSDAQRKPPRFPEQTDFSAEAEGAAHPVPIPDGVLTILEKDDFVRPDLQEADPPVQTPPSSWFSAAKIHLSKSDQQDLVILGEGPLAGANVIMFWIFRNTGHGYDLVLRTGGHDLHVKRRRSNGYRDIETDSVTMMQPNSELFRFDGRRYVLQREKTEPIK